MLTVFLLLLCILETIVLILNNFNIISIDKTFNTGLILDSFVFTIFLLTILYQGATINDFFAVHINIMRENKTIINDLYRNKVIYFSKNYVSNNFVYNYAADNIKKMHKDDVSKIPEYLKELL